MPTVAKERVANRRTLVRMATSRRTLAVAAGQARSTSRSPLDAPAQYVKGVGPARAEQLARLGLHTVEDLLYHVPQDRKSTRLNSSHRCISYAVFCLKKKKKNKLML